MKFSLQNETDTPGCLDRGHFVETWDQKLSTISNPGLAKIMEKAAQISRFEVGL